MQRYTLERAKLVHDLTYRHYEVGRHDRCKLWVYRHVVSKAFPISERTFFRYLKMIKELSLSSEGKTTTS